METGAISHAEIEVRLTDADGTPLPGVNGSLHGGRIDERTEVSNAHGRMVFEDLAPATYELNLELEGFATVRRDVTIHETNEHEPLEVTMRPDRA